MAQTEITDIEIIERVKAGELSLYSLLVRRHQESVLRMCIRVMKDQGLAEDMTQEAFVRAYENLHRFEGRSAFKSWLIQIALNNSRNKLRSQKNESLNVDDIHLSIKPAAETDLINRSVSEMILRHVDGLPQRQRMALTLRIYEDMSFKEIAELMNCPYDTAKANYRHALINLKDELLSCGINAVAWLEAGDLLSLAQEVEV